MNEKLKAEYARQIYKDTECWTTKEVYEYFAEVVYQNEQLKDRIAYLERSISRKEETIIELQHELVETPKESELKNRINTALFELRKYKLVRNNDDLVSLCAMYEFLIDNSIEILKGDKE